MQATDQSKSSTATRGFHNRITIVFDFDRTLTSGTVSALLERIGVEDGERWRNEQLQPMIEDGWTKSLRRRGCSRPPRRSTGSSLPNTSSKRSERRYSATRA